jgi:hypothetical protein
MGQNDRVPGPRQALDVGVKLGDEIFAMLCYGTRHGLER